MLCEKAVTSLTAGGFLGLENKAMALEIHLYSQRKQHLQNIVTINTKENKGKNFDKISDKTDL